MAVQYYWQRQFAEEVNKTRLTYDTNLITALPD